jgi:hypothetical protein
MHTIRLDVSNDIYDKVMFILENLPKNKVSLQVEKKEESKNNSKLDTFRKLRDKSNNKTELTMDRAINTTEMVDDGIF